MAARDQIVEMLAQGIPGTAIAAAAGVSESYVSQLAADEDIQALVVSKQTAQQTEDKEYDSKLDRVEEGFLDRIEDKSKFANLSQSLQAYRILNAARRRKESRNAGVSQSPTGTIVNITLPIAVIPQFVLNSSSEIVEVQGKTMISATVREIDSAIASKKPVTATPAQLSTSVPSQSQEIRGAEQLRELSNRVPVRSFKSAIQHATGETLSDLL